MSYSPWGKIQHTRKLDSYERGVIFVSTAGHGGYRVSKGFAAKHLSEAARSRALLWGNYLWFEEDCDAAMVMWELKQLTVEEREVIKRELSRWNPDYLLELGESPSPKEYGQWLDQYERDLRVKEQHPDQVVSASWIKEGDKVRVITADRKEHIVTREAYSHASACNYSLEKIKEYDAEARVA